MTYVLWDLGHRVVAFQRSSIITSCGLVLTSSGQISSSVQIRSHCKVSLIELPYTLVTAVHIRSP